MKRTRGGKRGVTDDEFIEKPKATRSLKERHSEESEQSSENDQPMEETDFQMPSPSIDPSPAPESNPGAFDNMDPPIHK